MTKDDKKKLDKFKAYKKTEFAKLAKKELKIKPEWAKDLKEHFNAKGQFKRYPLNYHIFLEVYKIDFPELFLSQLQLLGYKVGFKNSELTIYPKVNKT